MNNSKLLYVAAILVIIMSCTRQQMPSPGDNANENSSTTVTKGSQFNVHAMARQFQDSQPISIDTANKMIMSYLNGINYGVNTDAPRSFYFNADTLRDYLNDSGKGKIKFVKFILAHQLDYINSGHEGQRPDSNTNALSLVIVGFDQNNNYVTNRNNKVYDHTMPCPYQCPSAGTAAYNIIQ